MVEKREGLNVNVGVQEDIKNGIRIAKNANIAIIFVKANSGEGLLDLENSRGDREDLNIWHKGNELIEKVAEVNENVIVVISAPSVVNVPLLDKVKRYYFLDLLGPKQVMPLQIYYLAMKILAVIYLMFGVRKMIISQKLN